MLDAKNKFLSPRILLIIAALVGLMIGFGLSYIYFQPRLESLNRNLSETLEDLSRAEGQITQLQSELTDTRIEKSNLEDMLSRTNATLSETMQELSVKKEELKKALEELSSIKDELAVMNEKIAVKESQIAIMSDKISIMEEKISKIEKTISKLENDRKLLIYLRIEMPETREDTFEYWQTIKNASIASDARLGPLVDEIMLYIDAYFDWLDKQPSPEASDEEWCIWLFERFLPPVIEYDRAINRFTKEVYLVIITHIELVTELTS